VISRIRKEVLDTLEKHYLTVTQGEGAVFHYPELAVGTVVEGTERARRIARLLDADNFIFRELTIVPGTNRGTKLSRKGRYLHPAILATTYKMFLQGRTRGTVNELATMKYAGPTYITTEANGDTPSDPDEDAADTEERTLWENGLQGPNTDKRIVDEVPRTVLGFVAACIRWGLRQYDVFGNRPGKLGDMSLDDKFVNEVTRLIANVTGLDMAMITREVKGWEKVGNAGFNVAEREDSGEEILSD
jgi:Domain of unknown function (DUF6532)